MTGDFQARDAVAEFIRKGNDEVALHGESIRPV
jgi:hypothetical protein